MAAAAPLTAEDTLLVRLRTFTKDEKEDPRLDLVNSVEGKVSKDSALIAILGVSGRVNVFCVGLPRERQGLAFVHSTAFSDVLEGKWGICSDMQTQVLVALRENGTISGCFFSHTAPSYRVFDHAVESAVPAVSFDVEDSTVVALLADGTVVIYELEFASIKKEESFAVECGKDSEKSWMQIRMRQRTVFVLASDGGLFCLDIGGNYYGQIHFVDKDVHKESQFAKLDLSPDNRVAAVAEAGGKLYEIDMVRYFQANALRPPLSQSFPEIHEGAQQEFLHNSQQQWLNTKDPTTRTEDGPRSGLSASNLLSSLGAAKRRRASITSATSEDTLSTVSGTQHDAAEVLESPAAKSSFFEDDRDSEMGRTFSTRLSSAGGMTSGSESEDDEVLTRNAAPHEVDAEAYKRPITVVKDPGFACGSVVSLTVSTGVITVEFADHSQAESGVHATGHRELCVFERSTLKHVRVSLPRPSVPLVNSDGGVFVMNASGLCVLLKGLKREELVDNTVIFQGVKEADHLCRENGWEPREARTRSLELGLQYFQVELIEELVSLELQEQLISSEKFVSSVRETLENVEQPSDRTFADKVLSTSIAYVTKLIRNAGSRVTSTHITVTHQALNNAYDELFLLGDYLETLRLLRFQLEGGGQPPLCIDPHKLAAGSLSLDKTDVAATPTVVSNSLDVGDTQLTDLGNTQLLGARVELTRDGTFDEWKKKSEVEVLKEALYHGRISTGLAVIRYIRAKGAGAEKTGTPRPLPYIRRPDCMMSFDEFRHVSLRIVYLLCCSEQELMDVASRMLTNLGENPFRFFREVAWNTTIRTVRKKLVHLLMKTGCFEVQHRSSISYLKALCKLYPNPCYITEYNRNFTRHFSTNQMRWGGCHAFNIEQKGFDPEHDVLSVSDVTSQSSIGQSSIGVSVRSGLSRATAEESICTTILGSSDSEWDKGSDAIDEELAGDGIAFQCGDIDDLSGSPVTTQGLNDASGTVDVATGISAEEFLSLRGKVDKEVAMEPSPKRESQDEGVGYLCLTLSWVSRWDTETRQRVLLERKFTTYLLKKAATLRMKARKGPESLAPRVLLANPPPSGVDDADAEVGLDPSLQLREQDLAIAFSYFVSHNDWRGLVQWVNSIPLDNVAMNERGELEAVQPEDDYPRAGEGQNAIPLAKQLLELVANRVHETTTSFVSEILLDALGKRGVFIPLETASFQLLLPRLARTGHLFETGIIPEGHIGMKRSKRNKKMIPSLHRHVSLQPLLPTGLLSPFHKFFIQHCVDHDLPNVLVVYLDFYKIGLLSDQLLEFTVESDKPWISLLLLSRVEDLSIFDLSLANAVTCLDFGDNLSDSSSSVLVSPAFAAGTTVTISSMMTQNRILMALGTMMYAPVPLQECLKGSLGKPWCVNLDQLSAQLAAFPTLRKFLQRIGREGEGQRPVEMRTPKVSPLAMRDISSSDNDISLSSLLMDMSQFDLQRVLYSTSSEIPRSRRSVRDSDVLARLMGNDIRDRNSSEEVHDVLHFNSPRVHHPTAVDSLRQQIYFFVRKCRPLEAIRVIREDFKKRGFSEQTVDPHVHTEVQSIVLELLVDMFLSAHVMQSCLSLLELLGASTRRFSAILAISLTLYRSYTERWGQNASSAEDRVRTLVRPVAVPNDISDVDHNLALKIVDALFEVVHTSDRLELPVQVLQNQKFFTWCLINDFSQLHDLPTVEVDSNIFSSDWRQFLKQCHFFPDIEKCDPSKEQFISLLLSKVSSPSMRAHIYLALTGLENMDHIKGPFLAQLEGRTNADLDFHELDMSLYHMTCITEWLTTTPDGAKLDDGPDLLSYAFETLGFVPSLIAVIAHSYGEPKDDTLSAQCLAAWILDKCEIACDQGELLENPLRLLTTICSTACSQSRSGKSRLLHGFEIFDPKNPLVHLLQGLIDFTDGKESESEQSFTHYNHTLQAGHHDDDTSDCESWLVGDATWVSELASIVAAAVVSDLSLTSKQSGLTHKLRLINVLQDDSPSKAASQPAAVGWEAATIELEDIFGEIHESPIWDDPLDRFVFWTESSQRFAMEQPHASASADYLEVPGLFFLKRVNELMERDEVSGVADVWRDDKIVLLLLAKVWLQGGPDRAFEACRPFEFLKSLEAEALLLVADSSNLLEETLGFVSDYVKDNRGHTTTLPLTSEEHEVPEMATGEQDIRLVNNLEKTSLKPLERQLEDVVDVLLSQEAIDQAVALSDAHNRPTSDLQIFRFLEKWASSGLDHLPADAEHAPPYVQDLLKECGNLLPVTLVTERAKEHVSASALSLVNRLWINHRVATILQEDFDSLNNSDSAIVASRLSALLREGTKHYRTCKDFVRENNFCQDKAAAIIAAEVYRDVSSHASDLIQWHMLSPEKLENAVAGVFWEKMRVEAVYSICNSELIIDEIIRLARSDENSVETILGMLLVAHLVGLCCANPQRTLLVDGVIQWLAQTSMVEWDHCAAVGVFMVRFGLSESAAVVSTLSKLCIEKIEDNIDELADAHPIIGCLSESERLELAILLTSSKGSSFSTVFPRFSSKPNLENISLLLRYYDDRSIKPENEIIKRETKVLSWLGLPGLLANRKEEHAQLDLVTAFAKIGDASAMLTVGNAFLETARLYAKAGWAAKMRETVVMGALLHLQACTRESIIGLARDQAEELLSSQTNFDTALIISMAYDLTSPRHWSRVVFERAVAVSSDDTEFLDSFLSLFSVNRQFCLDLSKRYKSHVDRFDFVHRMKRIIVSIGDMQLRAEIAQDLQIGIDFLSPQGGQSLEESSPSSSRRSPSTFATL